MNAIQTAKAIIRIIDDIEANAIESEWDELNELSQGDDMSLQVVADKLVKLNQRVNERIKTERYRISIVDHEQTTIDFAFNQDTTMKEFISELEKTAHCDISDIKIRYICRE